MKLYRMLFAMAFSAMSMVAAVGCGDEDNKTVSDLDLTPDTSSMKKGETLQYTLKVMYSDGTSDGDMSSHADVEWISSDAATATVSADGLVTAIDEGTVTITARFGGQEESESLVILP
ncbi:Ig-like domain-containing protein [Polyangium mundeleinium]|uniref:Ig-like domain-containing protein n=1 Tax=Polyangium mundeleinium TaxID=2995306 RepID=A0ABT5EIJ8_9BACT|nr:Ig-like domain-containing protein [Polyangium mundeleinium]MDC0741576.1 Ig-like domain-containing protein [Polyangium mundeleinium]